MDALLILAGLFYLLVMPILAIVALVKASTLAARLEVMARDFTRLKVALQANSDAAKATEDPADTKSRPPVAETARPSAEMAKSEPEPAPAAQDKEPDKVAAYSPVPEDDQLFPSATSSPPPTQGPSFFDRFFEWLKDHWVYALAATSLALAGVFLVRYGMERGLLSPAARVTVAVGFGLALIGAGEFIRRRWGDAEDVVTAYLPSVFAGAGIVTVFSAIVAGRQMYGLFGPEVAFAALVLTAVAAIAMGWRYGALLSGVGLIGAMAVPFLAGGGGQAAAWLYLYYLAILSMGLVIDAYRRWRWVSVVAIVAGLGGLWLMYQGGAGAHGYIAALVGLAFLTIHLPRLLPVPDHPAPNLMQWLIDQSRDMPPSTAPVFAVHIAAISFVAVCGGLLMLFSTGLESQLAFTVLAGLAAFLPFWLSGARGLGDLPLIAAAAMLGKMAVNTGAGIDAAGLAPAIWQMLAMAVMVGLVFLRQARGNLALPYGLAAVVVPGAAVGLIGLFWNATEVLGPFNWATAVMAVAALMAGMATIFARQDGGPARRTAWAVLASLSLIALALNVMLSDEPLTIALAALLVAAAWLDRRLGLFELAVFVQAGVAVVGFRLLVDPGIGWALTGDLLQVAMVYAAIVGASLAALRLIPVAEAWAKARLREGARAALESLWVGAAAIYASCMLTRALRWGIGGDDPVHGPIDWAYSHWGLVLWALPWTVMAASQAWRSRVATGWIRTARQLLCAIGAGLAGLGLFGAITAYNPVFANSIAVDADLVYGWPFASTLLIAYGLPPILAALAWRGLSGRPGQAALAIAVVFGATYVILSIRHIWHGPFIAKPEIMQGELYTYTVALLVAGGVALWQALRRKSRALQRVAMGLILLATAKVYLWDAAGLSGLLRVASFAGLGLTLAGLAWLNRWVASVTGQGPEKGAGQA